MKGVINLYKPKGITSSAAVVTCRKILGTKAIGHMGTLDPQGEGVLLLGVGKATRLFDFFLKKDKVYEAEFAFGYTTDTLDGDGAVIETTGVIPSRENIEAALSALTGQIKQIPPKYSAKSVGGVRSYKLARAGIETALKACDVEIYSIELIRETSENTYLFKIHCSAGTYIRSICRDLAESLGSLATMVSIKRTRCGNFLIENSVTFEELEKAPKNAIISCENTLSALEKFELAPEYYEPILNGIKICSDVSADRDFALYCKGELFGIACVVDGFIKIKTYLRD